MGIVAALLAMALAAFALYHFVAIYRVRALTQRANSAVAQAVVLAENAQLLDNGVPDGFSGVTAAALITNGAVPPVNVSGSQIVSAFQTPVAIATGTTGAAPNDSISFTYSIPVAACPQFVIGVQDVAWNVVVNGAVLKTLTQPLSVATAVTSCNSGATQNATVQLAVEQMQERL